MELSYAELIARAKTLVRPITLTQPDLDAATVGCVLVTENNVYEGVCIHLSCGLGFCAEAAAIANMIKGGETKIKTIVAVSSVVISPYGRCREMMVQVDRDNFDTDVLMPDDQIKKLRDLLPHHWM